MKKLFILLAFVTTTVASAQSVAINTDGSAANASAILDLTSATKGFLPPRMTHSQKIAISSPANGLIVWCTNCGTNGEMQVYNGVAWINFSGVAAATPPTVPGAPTNPVATAGNAQASVAFTAPVSNGGSAITGYTATSFPGGFTATGASSPLTFTGLTNGTAYIFNVIATNAQGNSVPAASAAVTLSACSANVGTISKTFMCYNLGVTGTQDPLIYQSGNNNGTIYQWGRQTDGHEVRTSLTQAGPLSAPLANRFITNSGGTYDWRNPLNNSLWLDASKTAYDPCPTGFRVPTQAQWGGLFRDGFTSGSPNTATRNTWTWTGNGYTVGSALYLPAAGYRDVTNATLVNVSSNGIYWSSTVSSTNAYCIVFNSTNVSPGNGNVRGHGYSVRCISE